MCSFFERKNIDKSVIRLGEEDYGIYETEKLLALNSYAASIGYHDAQYPFPNVTSPSVSSTDPKEYMGFSYNLPEKLRDVSNPTDPTARDIDYEDESGDSDEEEETLNDYLTEAQIDDLVNLVGDELDVEVVVDDNSFGETDSFVAQELQQLQIAEEAHVVDTVNKEFIQKELLRLIPNSDGGRESTLQAFNRLTNDYAWIPFRMPDSATPATDTNKAEAHYFTEQEESYSVTVKSGPRSYRNFSVAWNFEVSRRFKLWSQGEDDVQQLRLKSTLQLEEYSLKRKQLQSLQRTVNDDDDDQALLNTQFRSTRQQLPDRQEPLLVVPPRFTPQPNSITPFANPTALNAIITMNAVMGNNIVTPYRPTAAPYVMQLPNLPPNPPSRPTRKLFRSKMYCTTCGWRKKEHTLDEGKGQKPVDCSRSFCGNCYQLKEYHVAAGIPFGVQCTNRTNNFCFTNVNDWWEYKVRAF
jgi:hypothetical protein